MVGRPCEHVKATVWRHSSGFRRHQPDPRHFTPSWYSSSKSQLLPGRWLPGRSSWMRIPLTVSVHVEYLEPMKVCARAQSSCSMNRERRRKCNASCSAHLVHVQCVCAQWSKSVCVCVCMCVCPAPARLPRGSSCRPSRAPGAPAPARRRCARRAARASWTCAPAAGRSTPCWSRCRAASCRPACAHVQECGAWAGQECGACAVHV